MTILTEIPNGASNADVRATLNDLFTRIQTREGGTMPVLTQILNGSSLADARLTFNDALARIAALESGGTPTPTPGFVGFYANGSTNPKLKAAFARVIGGNGRAKMVIKGDSTSVGQWGNDHPASNGVNGSRPYRPAAVLASLYTAAGVPMLDNGWYGDPGFELFNKGDVAPFYSAYDTRFSANFVNTNGSNTVFAGGSILSTGAGGANGSMSLSLTGIDTFALTAYVTGSPVVQLKIDGANPASGDMTLDVGAQPPYMRTGVFKAASVGAHYGGVLGPANFRSIYAYDSTVRAWDILVHAHGGATTTQHAASDGQYQYLDSLKYDAPDLTVLNQCINDMGAGVAVATVVANIQAQVTAGKISGDLLWIFPHPVTNVSAATQASYRDACKAAAASAGVAFLDLFEHYGSGTDSAFATRTKDGVHPLGPLYAEIAGLMKAAIEIMRA